MRNDRGSAAGHTNTLRERFNGAKIEDLRNPTVNIVDVAFPGNASSRSAEDKPSTCGKKSIPIGSETSLEMSRQVSALKKGAEAVKSIDEASRKRCNIAKEMLSIDKYRSMIALFSRPGTDESMKARFVYLTQMRALANLEKYVAQSKNMNCLNTGEGSEESIQNPVSNQSVRPNPLHVPRPSSPDISSNAPDDLESSLHSSAGKTLYQNSDPDSIRHLFARHTPFQNKDLLEDVIEVHDRAKQGSLSATLNIF